MTIDDSVLRSEIDLLRHGVGDAEALVGSLRRSVLPSTRTARTS